MRFLVALLILIAQPVVAASPPTGCATLCGTWQIDASRSDDVAAAVDAALETYKPPRNRRIRDGGPDDTIGQIEAEMERSLGPIQNRPRRTELHTELSGLLTTPQKLVLDNQGASILVQGDQQPARRFTPGTPHSRVTANGTARIQAGWKSGTLTLSETFSRRDRYTETYSLQRADASLLVTREVRRPGMKTLLIRSVYRRN